MSAIRLLVLGAIRQRGRAHGYQVRSDLEAWGAHEWSTAKPGSIYHALRQMAKQGLLRAHDIEPSPAGPPRVEYELTGEGDAEFLRLLRTALSRHDQKIDELTAAVGFLDSLPREEAIALLKERVTALDGWRAEVARHWTPDDADPGDWEPITEIMRLWTHFSASGAEWTRGLIQRLERGTHREDAEPAPSGSTNR
ncbi:DNA-binding PadR family transcriptional regulator [Thermocatellispora tengchongensis]|uniref:DNA-binding PadR family transcriptional regulator n=1 Tax=Thermocatellispora tengchongensis TaxID=1073253 RepID=A0A840NTA3_9ACTN|nr:PadR family transcriptional regulator [Thermocatellispora tengchongensis]MBB5130808.1 DNA-binding PadR family transcriptional regulator [Thermocatellispora tengchongensis]